jgi:hypothetical protein
MTKKRHTKEIVENNQAPPTPAEQAIVDRFLKRREGRLPAPQSLQRRRAGRAALEAWKPREAASGPPRGHAQGATDAISALAGIGIKTSGLRDERKEAK